MDFPLYADLLTGKLVNREGSSLTIPPLVLADTFRGTLRFLERTDDGVREKQVKVRSLRASIGKTMEPPSAGTFTLRTRDVVGSPGMVTITPTMAHYLVAVWVFEAGNEAEPFFTHDVLDETTLAAGVAEIAADSSTLGKLTATMYGGNAVITAADPSWGVKVDYATYAPDDPEADFQPAQVTGQPTPASNEPSADCEPINWDDSAGALSSKLAPILPAAIGEVALATAGCWLFRLETGASFALEPGTSNRLSPISMPRVRFFQRFGVEWWCEVRLIQLPLAWNEAGHERILAAAPTVQQVHAGDPGSEVELPSNEIQALRVPGDFVGTYFLKWNGRRSKILGNEDDSAGILAALNGMFSDGKQRFDVSNPELEHAYIEFVGELAGASQPLITVEVNTFEPGVITFEMNLGRAPMVEALRTATEIVAPLEIEIEYVEDDEDPEDPLVIGKTLTIAQQSVTVVREQIWEELATVQAIDWLKPPAARDYRPFTRNQIITGSQHYVSACGDGELRSFSFAHNLGTEALHITVRENISSGRVLVLGVDYDITIPSANEVVLDIRDGKPTPAPGGLAILITSAGPKGAFQDHEHEIEQVNGLAEALEQLTTRLQAVEDLLPSSTLARRETVEDAEEIELPSRTELFPGRLPVNFDLSKLAAGGMVTGVRPSALLPAVHNASVTTWSGAALPAATGNAGNVWQVGAGKTYILPGGGGRRSATVKEGDFFASDGRFVYAVRQSPPESGTAPSTSYFPTDFERELFLLHINEAQWQPGGHVEVTFSLELQSYLANTRVQWLVVIEAGMAPGQSTPAPVGTNLADITWMAKPMMLQRVVVSEVRVPHRFGVLLKRATDNTLSAERLNYTAWSAAPAESVPTVPGVVLRARLIQFDTENSVKGTGFLLYRTSEAKAEIA